jgi:hypothetical protein
MTSSTTSTLRTQRRLQVTVALIGLALSFTGCCYAAISIVTGIQGEFKTIVPREEAYVFHIVFFSLSGACVAWLIAVLWCATRILRASLRHLRFLGAILVGELAYLILLVLLGRLVLNSYSAAAIATANVGFVPQILLLYPVWAPFVIGWVLRRSRSSTA